MGFCTWAEFPLAFTIVVGEGKEVETVTDPSLYTSHCRFVKNQAGSSLGPFNIHQLRVVSR